jgi:hypothetical protein
VDSDVAHLSLDICYDAIIGSRRRTENRDVAGHPLENVHQAAVVWTKVMAPIRNAVGLIDDQQANYTGDWQQHIPHKFIVGEALGSDQQRVSLVCQHGPVEFRPFVSVSRVYAQGSDAEPIRGFDLIAHQG